MQACSAKMNLSEEVDLEDYVGRPDKISNAEIAAICQEAGMHAVRKNRYVILPKDFEKVRHLSCSFMSPSLKPLPTSPINRSVDLVSAAVSRQTELRPTVLTVLNRIKPCKPGQPYTPRPFLRQCPAALNQKRRKCRAEHSSC